MTTGKQPKWKTFVWNGYRTPRERAELIEDVIASDLRLPHVQIDWWKCRTYDEFYKIETKEFLEATSMPKEGEEEEEGEDREELRTGRMLSKKKGQGKILERKRRRAALGRVVKRRQIDPSLLKIEGKNSEVKLETDQDAAEDGDDEEDDDNDEEKTQSDNDEDEEYEDDELYDTAISTAGVRRCTQKSLRRRGIIGSVWTAREKDIFFNVLGRYGIAQINKIQEYLPAKSTLEIMTYYNLLHDELQQYKRSKIRFTQLVRYDEIPEAIEMDCCAQHIEERMSYQLMNPTTLKIPPLHPENDTEDTLLNPEPLIEMSRFVHMTDTTTFLNHDLRLDKDTFTMLNDIVRDRIEETLILLIRGKLRATSHGDSVAGFEDDILPLRVVAKDVWRASLQMNDLREITIKDYFREIGDRLRFRFIDDEKPKTGVVDDAGRDEGQLMRLYRPFDCLPQFCDRMAYRAFKEVRKEIHKDGLMNGPDTSLDNGDSVTAVENIKHGVKSEDDNNNDSESSGPFIEDNSDDEALWENDEAMALFLSETERLEDEHDKLKKVYNKTFVSTFELEEDYESYCGILQKRREEATEFLEKDYRRYYLTARKAQRYLEKTQPERGSRTPFHLFHTRNDHMEMLKKKLTKEMFIVHNYMFPHYPPPPEHPQ